ncbi:MAG: hypothetical protein QXG44_12545 [Candidatus Jordarchaeaceae archaeon]
MRVNGEEKGSKSSKEQDKDEYEKEEYEEEYEEDGNEWYNENDEYGEDENGEDLEVNLDENFRKVLDTVKKELEANTDYSLVKEHVRHKWLHVYRLEEKKPGSYVPIEVHFNLLEESLHLCFELSLGLHIMEEMDSIEELAQFYQDYADYMESREQEILELGFYLEDSHIQNIHHIYFYYQKDFAFNEVEELVNYTKKLLEKV